MFRVLIILLVIAFTGGCAGSKPGLLQPQTEVTSNKVPEWKPVALGQDDIIRVRAMSVRLPAASGWRKRVLPLPPGDGKLTEFERNQPSGNVLQIHVVDYYGKVGAVYYLLGSKPAQSDEERLAEWLALFKKTLIPPAMESKEWRTYEWTDIERAPRHRYGAACHELHVVREDRETAGGLFLWQDWMLFCVDPVSHVPFEIDYAERYPAANGAPSATFASDAAALFDSVQFSSKAP